MTYVIPHRDKSKIRKWIKEGDAASQKKYAEDVAKSNPGITEDDVHDAIDGLPQNPATIKNSRPKDRSVEELEDAGFKKKE